MSFTLSASQIYTSLKHGLRRISRLPHYYHDVRNVIKGTTSLLALPSEIREIIYEHIFEDTHLTPVKPGKANGDHLSLLLLCKASHNEINDAMLKHATIFVYYEPDLVRLQQMKHVFQRMRHIEIRAALMLDFHFAENAADGRYTWEGCFLSALPNLQTITVFATPPCKDPTGESSGSIAVIDLDDGSIGSLRCLYQLVAKTDTVAFGDTQAQKRTKYFEGEFWKEKAEQASKTKIGWTLKVPLLMELQWEGTAGISRWKRRRTCWRERWVYGELEYNECVLRLEVGAWKYEFPQLQ